MYRSSAAADRRLFFLLHRAHRALTVHGNAQTHAALGISASQLTALHHVSMHPGGSMTALADLLDLNKSAVTGMVQRLEGAGLLRRAADPSDRRAQRLFVTPEGEAVRARSRAVLNRLNAELVEGFGENEIETVLRFLRAIVERHAAPGADDESG